MARINVGELDREFTISTPTVDALDPEDYTTIESGVWGAIRFAGGNERLGSTAQQAQGQFVVTFRYREDLTAEMRITEDYAPSRSFQILFFGDPDGSRERTEVTCIGVQ
jgi:head-tail adaptor